MNKRRFNIAKRDNHRRNRTSLCNNTTKVDEWQMKTIANVSANFRDVKRQLPANLTSRQHEQTSTQPGANRGKPQILCNNNTSWWIADENNRKRVSELQESKTTTNRKPVLNPHHPQTTFPRRQHIQWAANRRDDDKREPRDHTIARTQTYQHWRQIEHQASLIHNLLLQIAHNNSAEVSARTKLTLFKEKQWKKQCRCVAGLRASVARWL